MDSDQLLAEAARREDAGAYAAALTLTVRARAQLSQSGGGEALIRVLLVEGRLHQQLGDLARAERTLREALSLAGAHPEGLVRTQAAGALASVYRARGRYAQAESLLTESIALAVQDPAIGARELAWLLNELAVTYKYTGQFDEAERIYQRALALLEQELGPEHPEMATVYHNLGGLAHARGDFAAALPYARRSVNLRERALGPNIPRWPPTAPRWPRSWMRSAITRRPKPYCGMRCGCSPGCSAPITTRSP